MEKNPYRYRVIAQERLPNAERTALIVKDASNDENLRLTARLIMHDQDFLHQMSPADISMVTNIATVEQCEAERKQLEKLKDEDKNKDKDQSDS